MYSLICRHAKVNLLPNQLPSDARISSFRLKVPSPELERSLKIKERLETSVTLKRLLLMLVLASTSMLIADGVVTPAMSGLFLFLWSLSELCYCSYVRKSYSRYFIDVPFFYCFCAHHVCHIFLWFLVNCTL